MISSILLAAGRSSRMDGENKLVKEIKGIPLIKHSIKSILGSSVNEIIVVLGYEKDVVKSLIEANKKIKFVYNKDYESGMASSIKIGIENISNRAEAFFTLSELSIVSVITSFFILDFLIFSTASPLNTPWVI